MSKSAATARLFPRCSNNSSNRSTSQLPVLSLIVLSPIWLELFNLLLITSATSQFSSTTLQSQPRLLDNTEQCQVDIPGDCNPYSCHGTCEGRYVRFWNSRLKIDRTIKSCQCVQVRLLVYKINNYSCLVSETTNVRK